MKTYFPPIEYKPEPEPIDEIGIGPNAGAHDVLMAIYRNPGMPLHTRMRAAIAAIPFESPKLAVTTVVTDESLAVKLDRAWMRTKRAMEVIEAKPEKPRPDPPKEKPWLPTVPDLRRFRRRF